MSDLDFLAEVAVAIPDRGQHMVSQWGRHSNRARGERRKSSAAKTGVSAVAGSGAAPPQEEQAEPGLERKRKSSRVAWAALLGKVWGHDVLACPKWGSAMKAVAAVTKPSTIQRILKHLGLFDEPRAPNVHECLTAPADANGQALLVFPTRARQEEPGTTESQHPEAQDPRLNDDWPVDPPFPED